MKKNDRRFGLSKRQYRKLTQAIRHLLYQLRLWIRRRLAPLGRGGRQLQFGRRGFVLPTAVIVLVVLTLTVAALMIRTLNRTAEVGGQRQTTQVLNATAPAIDRARAKLEYFFSQDPLRPNGVPGEETIEQIIGNRLDTPRNPDPYTMADEQRIDINGDGQVDNAWVFQPTSDSIVAYSILMRRPSNAQLDQSDAQKAGQLITRSRPMGITELGNQCSDLGGAAGQQVEVGWDEVGSAILRKNFQINAFVYENRNGGQALSTIEFVQERQMERGNKWGAWFRNDLEIFPGPEFRWNGALHTEGSVFLTGGTGFTAYLISAPKSCVYTRAASEITATEIRNPETNEIEFQGQFMAGSLRDNNTNAPNVYIHSYREPPSAPYTSGDANPPAENVRFNANRDSVKDNLNPADIALNPVAIVTEDRSRARGSNPTNVTARDSNWSNQFYVQQGRFDNKTQPKPYVDDTYRADDRYGPKPVYDVKMPASDPLRQIPPSAKVGDPIGGRDLLTRNVAPPDSTNKREDLGLDGYWERRARQEGLRIIVGERLELGKPLDPPATADNSRGNEFYQHRTLRDDLAAVQATAVYHYKARGTTIDPSIPDPFTEPYPGQNSGGYEPIACLATTHHHGTPQTALRSIMFNQYDGIQGLPSDFRFFDFFTGRGTNGWEFEPPNFNSPEMRKAMRNLVDYAGDGVDGAFPPKQEIGGTTIHPNPDKTRAGNFSNLDRALQLLEQRGSLSALSLADQSTIHTAGCMLGMLAYSVNTLENLNYQNLNLSDLNNAIGNLRDGNRDNGEVIFNSSTIEVYRKGVNPDYPLRYRLGNEEKYLKSDAYITALVDDWKRRPLQETNADVNARLARLIALTEQVKYDLNPQEGYTCGIPNGYSNLREAFCAEDQRYPALQKIFNPQGTLNLSEILNGIRAIAANPRMNPTDFLTPIERVDGNNPYPSRLNQIIGFDGNARNVAFLDNTLFNGREEMAVREMDIDLDLLRRRTIGGDTWLPMGGIVYAFREDAVREDGIARPAITGQNWMNTNPSNPHDPIRAANGISTKPVDFFADPMRRPNGFRLWNGRRLDRQGIPAEKNIAGLSFISDNPVYIQGNFNLHSTNGTTNNLEEFTTTRDANWSNFYSRDTLDNRFARPNSDTWRPAEILGDAVTILSDNFCNGSANDYFAQAYNDGIQGLGNNSPENLATYVQNTGSDARVDNGDKKIYPTCADNANLRTSFLNANRPRDDLHNNTVWRRESPFDPSSPIYVDRNGTPWVIQNSQPEPYNRNFYTFNDPRSLNDLRSLNDAQATQVNAVIISGIVPSRPTQSYGGMHNFPRFLERWGNLTIQGSFIQLNFSTQATGPFDQDQWEIPNDPRCRDVNTAFNCPAQSVELIQYYGAPTRRWGYDVGLQLAPAGPVARRFITPGRQRNEFYTELRADDPYILRLRCAQRPSGSGRVDPTVSNCPA
ncbi:hormogonium polysaccharide biosynthesis protein HpsA [Thermosynechococcus sp. GLH187]|uniref:hormogonium polysaccharide biosynthesis protein HpsA n=1 Tax=unclassified Thermosynechococcus TaxID=2622553 RepID=UPI00287791E2|nr:MULTISPECIES: hormogonium polysaccharide biosynthesis protein HpsA [unclassified Thermosynechococcus]WNC44104.1 hormogonium polysaccharide biosynthesis protein HpsA [Thermosynechococcus sp. GLH187]WNC46640.1 hormogonium polysaccharide biosynthesis protein HpsA [Thermosynechococcus sp. GLH333]WNC49177.1 hormogonium polysaccharide biosynthesis protein HpsA [Thermosynechococcus sp. GLH87]